MKFVFVALAAMAAVATAQLDGLADCASTCISPILGGTDKCKSGDYACFCKDKEFISEMTGCVQNSCDAADFQKTYEAANALCKGAGVELAPPPSITPAPTDAPNKTNSTTSPKATSTGGAANIVHGGLGIAGAVVAGLIML